MRIADIGRPEALGLAAILVLAFASRLLLATFYPTIYHPDEVFQYLEQGHRLAFGYGAIPWEYREGIRSWLLPGALGALMWSTAALGGGVTAYLAVVSAALTALSTTIVLVAWFWARRVAGRTAAAMAGLIAATWFELVYFGAKPLTEVVAGSTLFAAAYLLCSRWSPSARACIGGGLLLGLTFVLRLHLAPAILLIFVAANLRASARQWLITGASSAGVVLAAGLLDWATLGLPFQSLWKNFYINVAEGRADHYGVSPWYTYIGLYVLAWAGAIVPMAALIFVGGRRVPLLLAVPFVIVASHTLLGHKEFRFVYPALPFLLLAAAMGTDALIGALRVAWPQYGQRTLIGIATAGWVVTSLALSVSDRFRPSWTNYSPNLAAAGAIRDRDDMCGLGLVGIHWADTGGYAYLHRDVPIYPVLDPYESGPVHDGYNVAISRAQTALPDAGFKKLQCFATDLCVYTRAGGCEAQPERMINSYLRGRNQ